MLRFGNRTSGHCIRSSLLRNLSSSSSSSPLNFPNSVEYPKGLQNPQLVPPGPPPTILHRSNTLSPFPSSFPRKSLIALSATLISAIVASYAVISTEDDSESRTIYDNLEHAVDFPYQPRTSCTEENDTKSENEDTLDEKHSSPHYADMIFLINPELSHWKCPEKINLDSDRKALENDKGSDEDCIESGGSLSNSKKGSERLSPEAPLLDVVFVHGLRGGPFKTWRVADDKSSTKSGLVEKIDEEAGKHGTFWPGEWLSPDFPHARMFSIKYKTNLTQWSGASLPLQKLISAGIGDRPVVFVTHSMGGLVVKQMLYQAKAENKDNLVNNTVGVVFYSCPTFGSKLADMPWRMGLVFRPAPTIGELRSGSPRLVELNDLIRNLHKKGLLEVLSFCETKVTPIVEGYGGWAFRMEIVPIESAYPGFGELVVLDSTDHVNSCKPVNRSDSSYKETLDLLYKLKVQLT